MSNFVAAVLAGALVILGWKFLDGNRKVKYGKFEVAFGNYSAGDEVYIDEEEWDVAKEELNVKGMYC